MISRKEYMYFFLEKKEKDKINFVKKEEEDKINLKNSLEITMERFIKK